MYAVYTKVGDGSGNDEGYYVTRTLSEGKTYIFGAVKAAANASLANNTTFGAVAFTNTYNSISPNWGARVDLTPNASGYIAADNASITDACLWTLESISSGKYCFKNGSNYIYLGTLAGSTTNGAQSGVSTSGNMYLEDANTTCKDAFLCHPASNSTNIMLYNTSNGYRMYASRDYSSTMTPYVRFYEYDSGYTTYYMTSFFCCSELASINGSINLTQSVTSSSITVSVLTSGANAYADHSHVSGYEFKLYNAATGGSQVGSTGTTDSDDDDFETYEFTGLTPLTQYWVTVRPIGDGSTYCNTTEESDRVGIYTDCSSPLHVDVSGSWDRFGGETISLTAAAYLTDGTSSAVPAAKITGYQWQKWYNNQWNDVSNGTTSGTTISGAATNNLQITNCTGDNSGSYRCVVSTVAGCDINSDGFQVKVYTLECYTGGTTVYNFTRVDNTQSGTVEVPLTTANTGYTFKIHADNDYYGNNGTINEDVTNWVLCNNSTTECTTHLTINSGLGGTFTITMEYSTSGYSSVEGEPEISVTYPRKAIYLTPGVWNSDGAKFAYYYFRDGGSSGWTDFISANDCGTSAEIPQWNGVKVNAVRLNSDATVGTWDKKWNQTDNITISSNNSIVITDWGSNGANSPYNYTTFSVPTYTISYAAGTVPTGGGSISGSKANETKTCGVSFALPNSAVFTTTGYTQTGWTTTDGGSQTHAFGGNYTTNAAQAFYPVWTANNYTLTWDLNGGTVTTVGTGAAVNATGSPSSSVAYATSITAPGVEKTGYTLTGWSPSLSSTMPAANTTYTATWTNATYMVTLNANSGTINAGDVTSYTYGTGATLPTNVTQNGYRFDGWFDNSGLTGSAVTNISTSETGNKEFWAKWTRIWTVDWYVGGSEAVNKLTTGSQTTSVVDGGKITNLPTTTPDGSACEKTFVGWTDDSKYDHGNSTLFTTAAESPTITGATSFYAVFASAGNVTYNKVTSAPDSWAGTYLFVRERSTTQGAVFNGQNANSNNYIVGTISNSTIAGSDALNECEITIIKHANDDYYSLKTHADKYLSGTIGDNALLFQDTDTTNYSISISSSKVSIIQKGFTAGRGFQVFNQKGSAGSDPQFTDSVYTFKIYDKSEQQKFCLYKKSGGASGHTIACADCGTSVTLSYSAPGNSNAMTVKQGTTDKASGSTVKTCSSVELTVTLTPASHYTVTGLTAKIGSTDMAQTHSGNVYTVTVPASTTGTLTLSPTFTAETPLTINFSVPTGMGTAGTIGTVYSGENFDFPDVTGYDSECVDFVGWVDATSGSTFTNDGTATSEPTGLFKYNNNSGAVTTNKTYKAVYREKVTSYGESYAKVTSTPASWANDHYLIVCENEGVVFDGSLTTLDAVGNNVLVTITAGVIPYSSTLAAKEFKIAAVTGGYTIKSASGYYIGQTKDDNGLASHTSTSYENTLSISSGDFDATCSSAHLRYNAASNQTRFRYYKSSTYSSQTAIQLYKYGINEVVTYTYTTTPTCGDKYFVTLSSVTGGAPTASPKAAADGTTINIAANPNTGYNFTSWAITKDDDDSDVTDDLLDANYTTASTSFAMPTYNVTVTATYTITNYTITYNNLNGASNANNPTSYTVATADIVLVDPGTRTGYRFDGWYSENTYDNKVVSIANGSTGNKTLYAKWVETWTITWQNDLDDNMTTTVDKTTALGGLPLASGSCEMSGVDYNNFVGWFTDAISGVADNISAAGTQVTTSTVPNANTTYHAVFTNMAASNVHTSNVSLPAQEPSYSAYPSVQVEANGASYPAVRMGTSSNNTSISFTVPSGTNRLTLNGVGWKSGSSSITVSTSVGTITPSAAQSLTANNNATGTISNSSTVLLTSYTSLEFTLANVNSSATITISNTGRVIIWAINSATVSGNVVGYVTSCCSNRIAAPVVTATKTAHSITLTWSAVSDATGYEVNWDGSGWANATSPLNKTGLDPETEYSWRVRAKYNSATYCGAVEATGTTETNPIYTVTYNLAGGTPTPAEAEVEEGATVTLPYTDPTKAGNAFAGWTYSPAVTVTNGQFTMPASDVTITATWSALKDRFIDRMHQQGANTDLLTGYHYTECEGLGYTVPGPYADNQTGADACETGHYVFVGWLTADQLDEKSGEPKTGAPTPMRGGTTNNATGTTYYAVWAEVE